MTRQEVIRENEPFSAVEVPDLKILGQAEGVIDRVHLDHPYELEWGVA